MPIGLVSEEADDSTRRQIDINIHGVVTGTKLALERMLPRGTGHIVNIASQAGKAGMPGLATYCGTKHFVVGFSEAVRGEVHETDIEISCVMPAIVNTELTDGMTQARGVKQIEPEDVANAIVEALEKPYFDVHVPKSAGRIGKVVQTLPRGARERMARALKLDKVATEVDTKARAAYEDRAAESEPSVDQKTHVQPSFESEAAALVCADADGCREGPGQDRDERVRGR